MKVVRPRGIKLQFCGPCSDALAEATTSQAALIMFHKYTLIINHGISNLGIKMFVILLRHANRSKQLNGQTTETVSGFTLTRCDGLRTFKVQRAKHDVLSRAKVQWIDG